MKFAGIIFLNILSTFCLAQNWQSLGHGISFPVRCLFYDSVTNYLYAGGESWQAENLPNYHSIARWNGNQWEAMGSGIYGDPVLSIIRYHDTIWVGGSFNSYLTKWDGQQWIAANYGFNGIVGNLRILNGNLYAVGTFDSVQGKAANGIAMFDGVEWSSVGNPVRYGYTNVGDVSIYNNEVYICGLITDSIGNLQKILKCSSYSWEPVGSGIHGSFSAVEALAIYKGELYAGGLFTIADGNNAGDYIVKWNGSVWSDVGGSVQGYNLSSNGQIHDLFVLNDNLYVGGVFSYADSIPANYIAKWNGSQWCSLGDTLIDNVVQAITAINDTLLMGGGFVTINTDSMFYIAKYLGGENVDSCSAPVGISEIHQTDFDLTIYPNPATSQLEITFPNNSQPQQLKITNTFGQLITQQQFPSNQLSIDVLDLPTGVYFLELQTEQQKAVKKFVKQ